MAWMGGEFGGEWIHVYVQLSPFCCSPESVATLLILHMCLHTRSYPAQRLHGLQPMSLLCPWNIPGKNTGVGCHLLFQGIFMTQGSNLHLLCLHRQASYHCATHIPMQNKKLKRKQRHIAYYIPVLGPRGRIRNQMDIIPDLIVFII